MIKFSKNNQCGLDLGPRTLKLKLVQNIIILNICEKLKNRSINEGARMMTKFSKNSHCNLERRPKPLKLKTYLRYSQTTYFYEVKSKWIHK